MYVECLAQGLVGNKNLIIIITEQGYSRPFPHLHICGGMKVRTERLGNSVEGLMPPSFSQLSSCDTKPSGARAYVVMAVSYPVPCSTAATSHR